jgi:RNA polymerase sigma-70 factor (ECF subfamily)
MFGVLYDRYEHLVYNKCYSFVNSIDEAKDLTQDVFFTCIYQIGSFKGTLNFQLVVFCHLYNFVLII